MSEIPPRDDSRQSDADTPQAEPQTSNKRLVVLVSLAAVLLATALAVGMRGWDKAPRAQPPEIDLTEVYPDVAAVIREALDRVRRNPDSGRAWGQLGMVLHAHEYYSEAIRCYDSAGELDPHEFRWFYYLANLLESSDRDAALAAYEKAVAAQPEIAQMHIRLGELLMDMGQLETAQTQFEKSLQQNAQNGQAQFRLAQIALQQNDLDASRRLAEQVAQSQARREVHELLVQICTRQGDKEAADEHQRLLRQGTFLVGYWPDPYFDELKMLRRDPLWLAYEANLLLQQGQVDESLAILGDILAKRPADRGSREQLANALIRLERREQAAEVLDDGLQQTPDAFELLRLRGVVYLLDEKWPKAEASFRAALVGKGDDARTLHDLAYCLAQQGQIEAAIEGFGQAIRYQPDFISARVERARLQIDRMHWADAVADLRAVLELAPSHPTATELLDRVPVEARAE